MANDQVSPLCAQCAENARWNEAGGYAFLAEQCRQYCRNGHREVEAACSQTVAPGPKCDGCQSQLPDYFEHRNRCIVTQTVEKEQGRWQQAIYELCRKHAIDPDGIDGGGCDSGDPLDLTLAEVGQVICQLENPQDYREAAPAVSTPRCPRCSALWVKRPDDFREWVHDGMYQIYCATCGETYSLLHLTDFRQFFQPDSQPSPVRESAWLIERGRLCLGTCEYRLKWVTFTDSTALRFSRQSDAYAFMEVLKWEPFKLFNEMQGAMPTEHMWPIPERKKLRIECSTCHAEWAEGHTCKA